MLEDLLQLAQLPLTPKQLALAALYAVVTGLLSLLLAKRSQVDAWAESKPRLAGVLKVMRGLGLDPWIVFQGLSLLFLKRLPKPPEVPKPKPSIKPLPPLIVLALSLLLLACTPSSDRCTANDITHGELGLIVAECAARRAQVCPGAGEDDPCPSVDNECDVRIDARCK